MFTAHGTHEARNKEGTSIIVDGYVLHYKNNSRAMEFGAQLCPPLNTKNDALFIITFPTKLQWLVPHRNEQVSAAQSQQIEKHISDALAALDCEADFTIPIST